MEDFTVWADLFFFPSIAEPDKGENELSKFNKTFKSFYIIEWSVEVNSPLKLISFT